MAYKADTMEVELASAVQKEMTVMVKEEEQLREQINKMVRTSLFLLVQSINNTVQQWQDDV